MDGAAIGMPDSRLFRAQPALSELRYRGRDRKTRRLKAFHKQTGVLQWSDPGSMVLIPMQVPDRDGVTRTKAIQLGRQVGKCSNILIVNRYYFVVDIEPRIVKRGSAKGILSDQQPFPF